MKLPVPSIAFFSAAAVSLVVAASVLIVGGSLSSVSVADETKPAMVTESGTAEDNAYAAKVWKYMEENHLVGKNRDRSYTFNGNRPHGSVQEVISTMAEIDGHSGRLIVKHNFGGESKRTPQEVYKGGESEQLEAVTIMFQREDGYDAANNNWFWAEYTPDSKVLVYEGQVLSGRSPLCIGCHTALGGKDLEIINGRE